VIGLGQLVDWIDRRRQRRTEVHVRVHRAWLLAPDQIDCYFVNVWNASPEREVTVTHVWIATQPRVQVLTKRLPTRIAPRAQWETFVPVAELPGSPPDVDVFRLARVQLADDTVIKSDRRENVPPAGFVPG
jgi:hypothetical protein